MKPIVILGIFVADTAYRAERQPKMGETILGQSFALGPGGKGSNQAVAAAIQIVDVPSACIQTIFKAGLRLVAGLKSAAVIEVAVTITGAGEVGPAPHAHVLVLCSGL